MYVHAVKSRIKSVQNIKKITSAMKMVAASKMRKAQNAQEQSVGMPVTFLKLFGEHTGTNLTPELQYIAY
jgi:F0F1-type ATP synthase gamma subunit